MASAPKPTPSPTPGCTDAMVPEPSGGKGSITIGPNEVQVVDAREYFSIPAAGKGIIKFNVGTLPANVDQKRSGISGESGRAALVGPSIFDSNNQNGSITVKASVFARDGAGGGPGTLCGSANVTIPVITSPTVSSSAQLHTGTDTLVVAAPPPSSPVDGTTIVRERRTYDRIWYLPPDSRHRDQTM